MLILKKFLNKKVLSGVVIVGGIGSLGTISLLNKQETEQKVEEDLIEENLVPPENIQKNEDQENLAPEIPVLSESKKEIKQEISEPTSTEEDSEEIIETKLQEDLNETAKDTGIILRGSRIYSKEDLEALKKRENEDEAFGYKEEALNWSGGNSSLNEKQKQEAKTKFESSTLLKNLEDPRELIDYEDYSGWRIKTSMYMRSDEYSPKELHAAVDEGTIDTDEDEGREQYAWRLREICYEAASYINEKERIKETFSVIESTDSDLSVINLCTFPKTSA